MDSLQDPVCRESDVFGLFSTKRDVISSSEPLTNIMTSDLHLLPHLFISVITPFYLIFSINKKRPIASTKNEQPSTTLTVFLATVAIVQLSRSLWDNDKAVNFETFNILAATKIYSLLLVSLLAGVETQRFTIWSLSRCSFWILMLVSDGITFLDDISDKLYLHDLLAFVLSAFCVSGTLLKVFMAFKCNGNDLKESEEVEPHPEEASCLLGSLTHNWVGGIVWRGYRRGLKEDDIPSLPARDTCSVLSPVFEQAWKNEEAKLYRKLQKRQKEETLLQKDIEKSKVNVISILIQQYGLRYGVLQAIKLVFELTQFFDPILTGFLLQHFQERDSQPVWKGYLIVSAMFVSGVIRTLGHSRVWTSVDRLAKNMKISLKMAVYKKTLTVKNEGKKDLTTAEIVNIVSDDCEHLINASNIVFLLFATPIQVGLALYMLYGQLGMGAFVGLAIMLALIPLNRWVGNLLKQLEKEKEDIKDKRVKMMNEVLNGIKVLKLYAWEKSFLKKIMNTREDEINAHKKICLVHAGLDFMFSTIPFMVRVAGFMTFIYLGGYLDPSTAFVTSTLFAILNRPFGLMAIIIPDFVKATSSLKKLNNILNKEDIPADIVSKKPADKVAIEINNGNFSWGESNTTFNIKNINMVIPKGKLVAVVGTVGSGKSSLLSAILGEMEKLSGSVTVTDTTAYVPQEPWILNASLQENVLFGSRFANNEYNKTVETCSLKDDFKLLSNGDKTKIGEKGINLSGGQKQRVSLARAVYADKGIYLLDDPLSAVDAHVGKHIFDHVIGPRGVLKDKTRVMVTHGVQWLPFVDEIFVMKEGKICESGSLTDLMNYEGAFAQFVREQTSNFKNKTEIMSEETENGLNDQDNKLEMRYSKKEAVLAQEDRIEIKESENLKETESEHEISETIEDDEEENKTGSVGLDVYLEYLKSVGVKYFLLCSVLFFVHVAFREFGNFELADWSDDKLLSNTSLSTSDLYQETAWNYMKNYAIYGIVEVMLSFAFISLVLCRGCEAAKHHHNKLLINILKSPMSFFDLTPTGRIINRFSKDIGSVDGLGGCLRVYIMITGYLLLNLLMVILKNPKILPFMIPITVLFLGLQSIFINSLREMRRYKSKSRSPIFVHLNETLNGTDSVRAYGVQDRFIKDMESKLEEYMKFEMTEHWFWSWFRIRIVVLSSLITLMSGILLLWNDNISPGMAGVVLCYATDFVNTIGWAMHHQTHTETELVSLERVVEYSNKPTEASWETQDMDILPQWPMNGELVLEDYQARYREGLDLVLKGVSCHIKSGEKIGIVGRTGAGKSSLTVSLFRLVEAADGKIFLNDQHIEKVGLHDLRGKLTILPQDPVIFGGTLRMNLDPFEEKGTGELWEALEHSHLKAYVEGLPDKLDHHCGEGGKNLSMGQRQLVCLARTLLRKSPVLVLDEATAGVDMETDDLIQKTIRSEFKACTVLTIAHRLNTVMDYDRIMVLDKGKIKEFDSPENLLNDKTSEFYSMAKDANLV